LIALAIAVFLPVRSAQAGSTTNANSPDATDLGKAGDYCVQKGGEVDIRAPYFNTNADTDKLAPAFRGSQLLQVHVEERWIADSRPAFDTLQR
jgi:hypothetical protein